MPKIQRFLFLSFLLFLSFSTFAEDKLFSFTILHTNDLHSLFEYPEKEHYAKLAYSIKDEKKQNEIKNIPTLVLDSGDFFSGSVYHVLSPNLLYPRAPELEFFKFTGYDAITLGNHEFDAGLEGLFNILTKNESVGISFVNSNTRDFSQFHFKNFHQTIIKELKQGDQVLRVGIIGLLPPNASKVSASQRGALSFIGYDDKKMKEDMSEFLKVVQKTVNELRSKQSVDIVVALMHGGTPENEILAKKVSGINVILSGHVHGVYKKAQIIKETYLAETGFGGQNLGVLHFKYKEKKLFLTNQDHVLKAINESTPSDKEYLKIIKSYQNDINAIFSEFGYKISDKIFTLKKDYNRIAGTDDYLGSFVASKLLQEYNKISKDETQVYLVAMASLRGDLIRKNSRDTEIYFEDIFRIFSSGFSEGIHPGFPIASFYLTKKDFIKLINVFDVYTMIEPLFRIAFSNSLSFKIQNWGIPFMNRITNMKINNLSEDKWPDLIKITCTSQIMSYLFKIDQMTRGLVRIVPLDKKGKAIAGPIIETTHKEFELFANAIKSE